MKRTYHTAEKSQYVLYGMLLVTGLLIVYLATGGLSDIPTYGERPNEFAGVLLGCFLSILSLMAIIVRHSRTVIVDGEERRIVLIDKYLGKVTERSIPFDDIQSIGVTMFGLKYASRIYDVVLTKHDGEKVSLFFNSYMSGAFVRREMERRKTEIEEIMRG